MTTHSLAQARGLLPFLAFVLLLGPAAPGRAQDEAGGGPPKPGCPFKVIRDQVQRVFGQYDRAIHQGGEVEGGEVANLIRVEQLTIYTCAFQRANGDTFQFVANFYPDSARAAAAFQRTSRAKGSTGPFYTSSRQQGKVQLFEGPGRSLSYMDTEVVILHWLTMKNRRIAPANVPGSTLSPIALAWFPPGGKTGGK
jgi:hypothetical protein